MQYYTSPNAYPAYGCTDPFYWEVKSTTFNQGMNETYITIDFGYDGDVHTETRTVVGDFQQDPEPAVIAFLAEYANSAGPIHGGGFPIRK